MASIKFTLSEQPASITLKAKLAWLSLQRERKVFIRTENKHWLMVNADADLNSATAFSNETDLIHWLEDLTQERMNQDKIAFLQQFCSAVPELITEQVATEMETVINTAETGTATANDNGTAAENAVAGDK